MQKHYCKYCGTSRSDVRSLTMSSCSKNPEGGTHVLYKGSEKPQYTCKYCGIQRSNIISLVSSKCTHHPKGACHEPAL